MTILKEGELIGVIRKVHVVEVFDDTSVILG